MAYEYENTVVAELTSLGMQYNSNAHYEMADEVKDVYAKAKVFDEIKKSIIQIKCNYKGNEERIYKFIARETEYIMDTEDK